MKIVTKKSATLGEEGGKWLKGLVDASVKKDKDYFAFMQNLRNLLSGEHYKNLKQANREKLKMIVNLAHAHVRTLVPTLFFQNPTIDCAPTAPQHAGKEKTWNGLINNTLEKIGFAEECKKVILDAVLYPEGVLKDIRNIEDSVTEQPNAGPTVWLTKGAPVHVRIAPSQLIVDYLVRDRDLDKARFIAIRYKKPLHELKMNPLYKDRIKPEFKEKSSQPKMSDITDATLPDSEEWDSIKQSETYAGEELVTIYEVWIHQLVSTNGEYQCYQQMCVLMEGQDAPIRELSDWSTLMGEGFNKYPVNRIVLNPIPEQCPQSELGVWQNLQMALNWLMSRITQLVENDRQVYAVDTSKLVDPKKAKTQFNSGRSREWIEVNSPDAIQLIQPTFAGRDNYSLLSNVHQFIQQVSGIGTNRRGGAGIRTATEASLVDEGTRIKTDEKVDVVNKFLIRVLTNCITIMRSIAKSARGVEWVFRVGGDIGAVNWLSFTPEDIDWLPDIRIRPSSFRKMDSLQELQKYSGLIGMAIQLFQLYGPSVRVDLLFSRMLESAGIYDSSKIIGNQDNQNMLQLIEITGILIGLPAPVLESHDHGAHIQMIDAFMASPYGVTIGQTAPEAIDRLMMHREEHVIKLQEMQQKAAQVQAQQNPFAAAGSSEATPQSAAIDQTSGDRTAVQAVPGGNGEFA